jgi:hypothetical protein
LDELPPVVPTHEEKRTATTIKKTVNVTCL